MKIYTLLVIVTCLFGNLFAKLCSSDTHCDEGFVCAADGRTCMLLNGLGLEPNRISWLTTCAPPAVPWNASSYMMQATGTTVEWVGVITEHWPKQYDDLYEIPQKILNVNHKSAYFLVECEDTLSFNMTRLTASCNGTYTRETQMGYTPSGEFFNMDVIFDMGVTTPFSSYVCWADKIVKYNTITFTASYPYTFLYNTSCNYLSLSQGTIYWASVQSFTIQQTYSYNNTFYKGDPTCTENCTTPLPFASIIGQYYLVDFEVVEDKLYYTTSQGGGVFWIYLNSTANFSNAQLLTFNTTLNYIFQIRIHENKIWFSENTGHIYQANLDGTGLQLIYTVDNIGNCVCAGANCTDTDTDESESQSLDQVTL